MLMFNVSSSCPKCVHLGKIVAQSGHATKGYDRLLLKGSKSENASDYPASRARRSARVAGAPVGFWERCSAFARRSPALRAGPLAGVRGALEGDARRCGSHPALPGFSRPYAKGRGQLGVAGYRFVFARRSPGPARGRGRLGAAGGGAHVPALAAGSLAGIAVTSGGRTTRLDVRLSAIATHSPAWGGGPGAVARDSHADHAPLGAGWVVVGWGLA